MEKRKKQEKRSGLEVGLEMPPKLTYSPFVLFETRNGGPSGGNRRDSGAQEVELSFPQFLQLFGLVPPDTIGGTQPTHVVSAPPPTSRPPQTARSSSSPIAPNTETSRHVTAPLLSDILMQAAKLRKEGLTLANNKKFADSVKTFTFGISLLEIAVNIVVPFLPVLAKSPPEKSMSTSLPSSPLSTISQTSSVLSATRDVGSDPGRTAASDTRPVVSNWGLGAFEGPLSSEHAGMLGILLSNRSAALLMLGRSEEALCDANLVARMYPKWWKSHARRAGALHSMGHVVEASSAFAESLSCSLPNGPEVHLLKEALKIEAKLKAAKFVGSKDVCVDTSMDIWEDFQHDSDTFSSAISQTDLVTSVVQGIAELHQSRLELWGYVPIADKLAEIITADLRDIGESDFLIKSSREDSPKTCLTGLHSFSSDGGSVETHIADRRFSASKGLRLVFKGASMFSKALEEFDASLVALRSSARGTCATTFAAATFRRQSAIEALSQAAKEGLADYNALAERYRRRADTIAATNADELLAIERLREALGPIPEIDELDAEISAANPVQASVFPCSPLSPSSPSHERITRALSIPDLQVPYSSPKVAEASSADAVLDGIGMRRTLSLSSIDIETDSVPSALDAEYYRVRESALQRYLRYRKSFSSVLGPSMAQTSSLLNAFADAMNVERGIYNYMQETGTSAAEIPRNVANDHFQALCTVFGILSDTTVLEDAQKADIRQCQISREAISSYKARSRETRISSVLTSSSNLHDVPIDGPRKPVQFMLPEESDAELRGGEFPVTRTSASPIIGQRPRKGPRRSSIGGDADTSVSALGRHACTGSDGDPCEDSAKLPAVPVSSHLVHPALSEEDIEKSPSQSISPLTARNMLRKALVELGREGREAAIDLLRACIRTQPMRKPELLLAPLWNLRALRSTMEAALFKCETAEREADITRTLVEEEAQLETRRLNAERRRIKAQADIEWIHVTKGCTSQLEALEQEKRAAEDEIGTIYPKIAAIARRLHEFAQGSQPQLLWHAPEHVLETTAFDVSEDKPPLSPCSRSTMPMRSVGASPAPQAKDCSLPSRTALLGSGLWVHRTFSYYEDIEELSSFSCAELPWKLLKAKRLPGVDPALSASVLLLEVSLSDQVSHERFSNYVTLLVNLSRPAPHPNVCQPTCVFLDGVTRGYVEFSSYRPLETALADGLLQHHVISPRWHLQSFFRQFASGLVYCHDRGVLLRYISSMTCMIKSRGDSDRFSVALFVTPFATERSAAPAAISLANCTSVFMAPEVIADPDSAYTGQQDIYACGATMLAVATVVASDDVSTPTSPAAFRRSANDEESLAPLSSLKRPDEAPSADMSKALIQIVGSGDVHRSLPPSLRKDELLTSLFDECMGRDPQSRPTASEVLSHPYFTASQMVEASAAHQIIPVEDKLLALNSFLRQVKQNQLLRGEKLVLQIRREDILDCVTNVFTNVDPSLLLRHLVVVFENEDAMDDGGVSAEMYTAYFSACTGSLPSGKRDPDPLFVTTEDSDVYLPNPNIAEKKPYIAFGRVLVRALVDNRPCSFRLALALWKHLLGVTPSLSDLEEYDASMARSLRHILISNDVESLGLTFENLLPDGDQVPVTNRNKRQFVASTFTHELIGLRKNALDAITEGFFSCSLLNPLLKILSPTELLIATSGNRHIDVGRVISLLTFVGFASESRTPDFLKGVLQEMTQSQLQRFLRLVTAQCTLRPVGFEKRITIARLPKSDLLPVGHTCSQQMDLPDYDDETTLREKLFIALAHADEGMGLV